MARSWEDAITVTAKFLKLISRKGHIRYCGRLKFFVLNLKQSCEYAFLRREEE